jgi:uncharacterized membrane protein
LPPTPTSYINKVVRGNWVRCETYNSTGKRKKSKEKLSESSREAMRSILKARDQRDLFELL